MSTQTNLTGDANRPKTDDSHDSHDEAREGRHSSPVTEGEVHEAAARAGVSRMAGHNDTIAIYEQTEVGKHFVKHEAPERDKQAKEEAKEAERAQKRMDEATKEYERRVKAESEQTKAVQDASQKAAVEKAEDDRNATDRTAQAAAKKTPR